MNDTQMSVEWMRQYLCDKTDHTGSIRYIQLVVRETPDEEVEHRRATLTQSVIRLRAQARGDHHGW